MESQPAFALKEAPEQYCTRVPLAQALAHITPKQFESASQTAFPFERQSSLPAQKPDGLSLVPVQRCPACSRYTMGMSNPVVPVLPRFVTSDVPPSNDDAAPA